MEEFRLPSDLSFNRGPIADARAFAEDTGVQSWLFMCGEEFAAMDGGMAYAEVQSAVTVSENIVADPPRAFGLEAVQELVEALGRLPRPTAVTCRAGPRSSVVAYVAAGLASGASADAVLSAADRDDAPFTGSEDLRGLVRQAIEELGR